MKKIISSILVFVLLSSSVLETYALSKSFTNMEKYNTGLANIFLTDLGNNTVKVNFQDITDKNAGTIVKSWSDKSTFPSKFVLEQGLSVHINADEMSKKLVKITNIKQKVPAYEKAGIRVSEVKSELRMLPDRLQLFETVNLTYKTKSQLDTIKSDVYTNGDFANEMNALAGKNIKPINKQGLSDQKFKSTGLSPLTALPTTQQDMDSQATRGLIAACKEQFGKSDSRCSESAVLASLDGAEKHITVEEKLEYSLIPPTSLGGDFDLSHKASSDVRISKKQISNLFQNYGIAKGLVKNPAMLPEVANIGNNDTNPLNQSDYCANKYSQKPLTVSGEAKGGVSSIKAQVGTKIDILQESSIQKCKELQSTKNKLTTEVYSKDLLNGFTLGEAESYEWKTEQKVDLWVKTITLYRLSAKFYYSYGFGIRIPIQAKVTIEDSATDDYSTSKQSYKIRIGMKTLDGNEGFYSGVGLDKSKIFAGKEFVLELSAGISLSAYVIGLADINVDISLISILAKYFSDILVNDLGIPKSEIDAIIKNNKFDKGKNFTPPFAGLDTVPLFDATATFPIYSLGVFTLLARLILETSISGMIKAQCHNVYTTGGCGDQEVSFSESSTKNWSELGKWGMTERQVGEGYKWREFDAKAFYLPKDAKKDNLGNFQNYGIILDTFRYLPTLLVNLFVQGGVKIGLPYVGSVELWTPKIKIFSMELSSDLIALDTHEGTSGIFEAFAKNKIYGSHFLLDAQKITTNVVNAVSKLKTPVK